MEKYIKEITEEKLKLFQQLTDSRDTICLQKARDLVEGMSAIDSYIVYSDCLNDDELVSLKLALSKLLKYASIDTSYIHEKKRNNSPFSYKEWESYTKDRKLSMYMFTSFAFKSTDIDEDDYERVFKLFDKETLEWLRNNTPHENVKESINYHYLKQGDNE